MRTLLLIAILVAANLAVAATSVTRFAITWEFDGDYTTGTYANGDPWVVENTPGGGVTIVDITPSSEVSVFKTAEVTISNASPAVVSWSGSDVFADQVVSFATTGELPSPLVPGELYQISSTGFSYNTSFRLMPLNGGSTINTTTAGSSTHTITVWRYTSGSMINPSAGNNVTQGFDGQLNGGGGFRPNLNVGRPGNNDIGVGNPLVVAAGSSLVSSVSNATAYTRPALSDASVLTALASAPTAGDFRPPYCGSDKTHNWNISDINYSALASLAPVVGNPDIAVSEADFERTWIEIHTDNNGRYYHPSSNQPNYGGFMAYDISDALLLLQTNISDAAKETLAIRMLQYGLDIYGAAVSGGNWSANGGLNLGRKAPLLMAGLVFNDSNILAYANAATHFIFQEDQQAFTVTEADVGKYVIPPRVTYAEEDVGLPEWGEKHASDPQRDNSAWAALYRNTNYSPLLGHILMAHVMTGGRAAWNNEIVFDYYDRVITEATALEFPEVSYNMWMAYRGGSTPPEAPPDAPSGLGATADGNKWIDLLWTNNDAEADYILIERRIGSGSWSSLTQVSPFIEGYRDVTVLVGTQYGYRVSAVNSIGASSPTSEATATTDVASPTLTTGWQPWMDY